MKHFYILENNRSGKLPNACRDIKSYLEERGASVKVGGGYIESKDVPEDTECVIAMGGDGTIMHTAVRIASRRIPVIGVNVGHLGYLSSAKDESEIFPMCDKLLEDRYSIEERNMLKGMWTDSEGEHCEYALNDIIIGRKATIHTIRVSVSVNGEFLSEYNGDGVIIATPTGSTAYNVASGGPIVEINSGVMAVTPICPHAFMANSMILKMQNNLEVKMIKGKEVDGKVTVAAFDGKVIAEFGMGETIRITQAEYSVPMIRLEGDTYFNSLMKKLNQLL